MSVPAHVMESIHKEVRTPHKYGVVLVPERGTTYDCPSVFRCGDRWYMLYIRFDGTGYDTHLAESADLLTWKRVGPALRPSAAGWDASQAGGYAALQDTRWGGSNELLAHDGKHWISYVGGERPGLEPEPLAIGLAWKSITDKPTKWTRIAENPVLHCGQPDVRAFEAQTLYKSNVIYDEGRTLGHPFVMFYNGKQKLQWTERIGVAVSDDIIHWTRHGTGPVVDNRSGISGDPQVTRIGDVWVMFYFGAFFRPRAFDTFACSYDLGDWTKWEGQNLVEPSEPWDKAFAHKPWVIKHQGIVYHYYCALGDLGRTIALATSKDLGRSPLLDEV